MLKSPDGASRAVEPVELRGADSTNANRFVYI